MKVKMIESEINVNQVKGQPPINPGDIKVAVITGFEEMKLLILESVTGMGWQVSFTQSMKELNAWLRSQANFDAVLIDLDTDGLDSSRLLKNLHGSYPMLKVVTMSQDASPRRVRMAMKNGVYDFMPKPLDLNDLKRTLQKTVHAAEELKKNVSDFEEIIAIEHELDVARNIQSAIIPDRLSGSGQAEYEISGRNQAAQKVGGDFFDYFMLDNNLLGFVIGDVASKGIPAAIFMSVSRSLFKAIAAKGGDPASCLRELNQVLVMESDPALFIAIFYGILELSSGKINYANGGHTYPTVVRKDGTLCVLDQPGGMVLGVVENVDYQLYHEELQAGDLFFTATDGFDELTDAHGKPVSDHFLKRHLIGQRHETVNKILDSIYRAVFQIHPDNQSLNDDITCLLLKYHG